MDDLFTKAAIIVAALLATLSSFPSPTHRLPEPAGQQQTSQAAACPNHLSRKGELPGKFDFNSAKTTQNNVVVWTTKKNGRTTTIEIPKDGCE